MRTKEFEVSNLSNLGQTSEVKKHSDIVVLESASHSQKLDMLVIMKNTQTSTVTLQQHDTI